VALALSLPEVEEKSAVLAATYAVVVFTSDRAGAEPACPVSRGRRRLDRCMSVCGPKPQDLDQGKAFDGNRLALSSPRFIIKSKEMVIGGLIFD